MAAVTGVQTSLTDAARKEDGVLGLIELLTPQENWFFRNLRRTVARDMVHFWHSDDLDAAGSLAVEEGAAYTYDANQTPDRIQNLVQAVVQPFAVTREAIAIETWKGTDELSYQTGLRMKEWSNAVEFDVLRSTLVSAAGGAAGKMDGILALISAASNVVAYNSGTVLDSSHIIGQMRANYDVSNGDVSTDLFTSAVIRTKIDAFTTKTNVVANYGDVARLVERVSVYDTSNGELAIHTHRYITIGGTDATERLLAIRPDKFALAFLEQPFIQDDLAPTGGFVPRAIRGSLTLECAQKQTNWLITGFKLS